MIRWLMRAVFLALFLGGLGGGIVYPRMALNIPGRELGQWTLFSKATGFTPAKAELPALSLPIRATLELRMSAPLILSSGGAMITLVGRIGSETVIATAVDVGDFDTRLVNPQTGELAATVDLGEVKNPRAGDYDFVAGPGDAESADVLTRADLILAEGHRAPDPYVQPVGFAALALGFIGLVLSFRSRSTPPGNPNSQPPKPKWGRGA